MDDNFEILRKTGFWGSEPFRHVWDNAAMEGFFSSLKTKRTTRKLHRTRDEAKADVFDYIERLYNSQTQRQRGLA